METARAELIMKKRLCFRLSAASCAGRYVPEHEYFGVTVGENEYYSLDIPSERLEYALFEMIVDVWRKRKGGKFHSIVFEPGNHDRRSLRLIVKHVRKSWQAFLDGDDLLAKYEFRTAETHWLRFGLSQMSSIAGKAFLDAQRRHYDGKKNVERRWKGCTSNKDRDKRIQIAAEQCKLVKELAESYNLTERRIQQIVNKKTK